MKEDSMLNVFNRFCDWIPCCWYECWSEMGHDCTFGWGRSLLIMVDNTGARKLSNDLNFLWFQLC